MPYATTRKLLRGSGSLLLLVLYQYRLGYGLTLFVRKKTIQGVDVNQLLKIKRQHLFKQIKYWRISTYVLSGLWLGLLLISLFNIYMHGDVLLWTVQLLTQSCVWVLCLLRLRYLKKCLPERLAQIDVLFNGSL